MKGSVEMNGSFDAAQILAEALAIEDRLCPFLCKLSPQESQLSLDMSEEAGNGTPPVAVVGPVVPKPPAAYVIVCDKEGGNPVELPLETDSALLLNTLQIEFTGAMGIKYRNPATGVFRVVAPTDDKLFPPAGGWSEAHYVACTPKGYEERPWASDGGPPAKMGRGAPPDQSSTNFSPLGARGITGIVGGPTTSPITGNLIDPITGRPAYSHCEVCNVYLNAPDQHQAHFNGKKHKEREMGRGRGRGRGFGGPPRGFGPPRGRGGPPPFRGGGRPPFVPPGGGRPPLYDPSGPQGLGGPGYTAF